MPSLIPAYTWSGDNDMWARRIVRMTRGDVAIITGPDSGPPKRPDPDLMRHKLAMESLGVQIVGYVRLDYGQRPITEVLADILAWRKLDVLGVFYDEWPTGWTMRHLNAMRSALNVRVTPGVIRCVVNPGTQAHNIRTAALADCLIVTHEGGSIPHRMVRPYAYEAAIVYQAAHGGADPVIVRLVLDQQGWRWTYVTRDGADGNPYDEDVTDA
jgi:hypothetical protein